MTASFPTCCFTSTLASMAQIFLAVFLLVFGFNLLIGVALPSWLIGLLALIAGILILAACFGFETRRGP